MEVDQRVFQVPVRGGWFGTSVGKALDNALAHVNSRGYRATFIIPEERGFFVNLLWSAVLCVTLGCYTKLPGVVVVGTK